MTLDAQDIDLLRQIIREEVLAAGNISTPSALPSRAEQIKAYARDPELARQMFRKGRKHAQG